MHLIAIICALSAAGFAIGAPGSDLAIDKRSCSSNNCARDLKNPKYSVSASSYCSSLIRLTVYSPTVSVPASTYQVVSTITPINTITLTSTYVETDPTTLTTTTTTVYQNHYRRAASVSVPKYASDCNAASISSACSCFLTGKAAPSPTTVPTTVTVTHTYPATFTAPAQTVTTTTTTSTTTLNPVETDGATRTLICGVKGALNPGVTGYQVSFYNSPSDCPDACQVYANIYGTPILSFALDGQTCRCYTGTVAQDTHADPNGLTYYDNGCPFS